MANQAQTQQTQQSQQGNDYFNLFATGYGRLSRFRVFAPKRGIRANQTSYWVSINALSGPCNEPDHTLFDVRVTGKEAIELLQSIESQINDRKRKVYISFKVGDIYPYFYERKKRDESGNETNEMETAALIKAHLVLIHSIKIDGEVVYSRPRYEPTQAQQGQQQTEGDPQAAQPAAQETPKPAVQPQSQSAARPSQGAPARASSQPEYVGTACEDDDIPF